nr:retrovirus-related Pol polyprotein from transposon TNT 1-94 [Tanacetum cinerariifolium]
MALAEENDVVSKEGAINGEWVKISRRKVHTLLEIEDTDDRKVCLDYLCIDLNYVEEQRIAVTDSSATDYDSADESLVCSIPLPLLKKLDGAEPISRPKTIKSILRSKSIFKAKALKDVTINKPSQLLLWVTKALQLQKFTQLLLFDEKRGTIFNSNKEILMIAPQVKDVYVLDMTSSAQESCFFAKASKNLNWL